MSIDDFPNVELDKIIVCGNCCHFDHTSCSNERLTKHFQVLSISVSYTQAGCLYFNYRKGTEYVKGTEHNK